MAQPRSPPATSGGARFNRLGAGKGYAAVVVRESDGRWRAVTLVLRRDDAGAWRVIDLRRVQEPFDNLAGGRTRSVMMRGDDIQRRHRRMRLSDFTTVELQRVARVLLRRYLDVQTGAISVAGLAQFLSPVAAAGLQRLATDRRARRTVRHGDMGPVTVLRLGPDRAYAAAVLARSGRAASAVLSVELEVRGQRPAAVRVGETESRAPSHQRRAEIVRVGPGQPVPEPPAHLAGLLGGLPGDPRALAQWTSAAAVIDTYRERYGIDDATFAFGPAPSEPEQNEERERALAYVRQLAREVRAIEPQEERALGRDRPAGPELGR